jgi:hypothetical protein
MQRRILFQSLLSFLAAAPKWARGQETALSSNDLPVLREVAAVVLPASLGRSRTNEIAAQFVEWVRGYKPGADAGHGYGATRLQVLPPSPSAKYRDQLRALAPLDAAGKRAIVEAAIAEAELDRLPQRPSGQHVAVDLMAFFFNSSAGEDLLYNAAIRREDCRGLANSGERPAPLRKDG